MVQSEILASWAMTCSIHKEEHAQSTVFSERPAQGSQYMYGVSPPQIYTPLSLFPFLKYTENTGIVVHGELFRRFLQNHILS
jgi:hypothetical protein